MKVLPDKLIPPDVDGQRERFEHVGKALFRADPQKVRDRLKAEEEARDKANGGGPRKRGRPPKRTT